ncbi:MAG TPA: metal-dependent hydrolase [Candidatus Xenobia bacterium]|nr:metal-dependent hydrolase [Candidatus Xenobia bacterium]
MDTRGVKFTWLGHGTFRIDTPEGKTVLIDPWVQGNPACPEHLKGFGKIDAMLITHGHFDHIADAVALAKKYKPQVVAIWETCQWLGSKGVENLVDMNKGGTAEVAGLRVTMVHADHSCGILDDGKIIYGGDPCGYVVRFPSGLVLYHSGDTNVFGDMRIIAELYAPQLACLPIGDHYTMSPREAAYAVRLLGVKAVIPMHYGTFPILTGTPDELRRLTADVKDFEVISLKPGESLG